MCVNKEKNVWEFMHASRQGSCCIRESGRYAQVHLNIWDHTHVVWGRGCWTYTFDYTAPPDQTKVGEIYSTLDLSGLDLGGGCFTGPGIWN